MMIKVQLNRPFVWSDTREGCFVRFYLRRQYREAALATCPTYRSLRNTCLATMEKMDTELRRNHFTAPYRGFSNASSCQIIGFKKSCTISSVRTLSYHNPLSPQVTPNATEIQLAFLHFVLTNCRFKNSYLQAKWVWNASWEHGSPSSQTCRATKIRAYKVHIKIFLTNQPLPEEVQ